MGMFDEVEIRDPEVLKQVVCAEGHPVVGQLQTKSIQDPCGDRFIVFNGKMYKREAYHWRRQPTETVNLVQEGVITLVRTTRADVCKYSGVFTAYTSCHECTPVYVERSDEVMCWDSDRLSAHHPWIEYDFTVSYGVLVKVDGGRIESRQSVREKLTRQGNVVLPDDDRIVRKAIQVWQKAKVEGREV